MWCGSIHGGGAKENETRGHRYRDARLSLVYTIIPLLFSSLIARHMINQSFVFRKEKKNQCNHSK
jgi:hypothetical protein